MTDAGTPSFPDDSNCQLDQHRVELASLIGPTLGNAEHGDSATSFNPADRKARRDRLPFVVQFGTTLYLVAEEAATWVLAELEFDAQRCQFSIVKQAHYRWPREALGRLLSRVMVDGDIDAVEAERMCGDFGEWMVTQFAA
jgi:hypothetical protein